MSGGEDLDEASWASDDSTSVASVTLAESPMARRRRTLAAVSAGKPLTSVSVPDLEPLKLGYSTLDGNSKGGGRGRSKSSSSKRR